MHDTWLRSFLDPAKRATATGNDPYFAMFEKATREHTVSKVDNQHALVRWNLLREAIFRLSSSPEAYLALRSQFAKTLANFNICSYILGIGDRHLENFLLDLKKYAIRKSCFIARHPVSI